MPESAPEVLVAPEAVAEPVPVVVPEQELPVAEEVAPAPSSMGFFAR
jgi:hypothetical protein